MGADGWNLRMRSGWSPGQNARSWIFVFFGNASEMQRDCFVSFVYCDMDPQWSTWSHDSLRMSEVFGWPATGWSFCRTSSDTQKRPEIDSRSLVRLLQGLSRLSPQTASDCLRLPVDICGFCQDMKWEEDHLISVTPSECAGCTLDTTWTFQLRRGTFQQCQQELRTSSLRSGGKAIQPQRIQRCS